MPRTLFQSVLPCVLCNPGDFEAKQVEALNLPRTLFQRDFMSW